MDEADIQVLRSTWAEVLPNGDAAAALFYRRLFEIAPDTRALFAGTVMAEQHHKLLASLDQVVQSADRLQEVTVELEALGARHVAYGVTEAHYERVGEALLWTLEQGLGPKWTPEAQSAWLTAYTLVSTVMKQGAARRSNA